MKLRVRKEHLADLTPAELAVVHGAGTYDTACLLEKLPDSWFECMTGHYTGR